MELELKCIFRMQVKSCEVFVNAKGDLEVCTSALSCVLVL